MIPPRALGQILALSLVLGACLVPGQLPPPLFGSADDPVDPSWCLGESDRAIALCSYEGCAPVDSPYLLEVARRPQNAVTAMVGIRVDGLHSEDLIANLDLRFVDDQGFELCARERRHLNTLCRESGLFVLEGVELYFEPGPHPQTWDGIEGSLSASIEVEGELLETELAARLETLPID